MIHTIIGPYIRDLEGAHCPGFSTRSLGSTFKFSTYIYEGKEIPDLSTQQQSTKSILVNSESLLFVDLCCGF